MPKGKRRKLLPEIDPDALDELERWHDLAWREALADALYRLAGFDDPLDGSPFHEKSGRTLH